MTGRLEIQWTPIHNKFVTWGSDFSLYEAQPINDTISFRTSHNNFYYPNNYNLLATNLNYRYAKCFDICQSQNSDILLGVGQTNGKVALVTFGATQYDSHSIPGKELATRHHPRQCNTVAWNPIDQNKIVAGLDRYRGVHSICLWDITSVDPTLPIGEFGLSDSASSLAWFTGNSKVLAAGMNQKTIRLIDFRDSSKAVNSTQTKAVHGVCIDSHNDKLLASYLDFQIAIWDMRNFEKPISTITQLKPIANIAWCPTKHNLLGSLHRDSTVINLYDIKHTIVRNEEIEPSILERVVSVGSPQNITSFSWHENDENRFISISVSGEIYDYKVSDRITLNWAPNSNIVWTHGQKTMKSININLNNNNKLLDNRPNNNLASFTDISQKIKERATNEYGLKEELCLNGELVDDKSLRNVWNWLHLSAMLTDDGVLRGFNSKHPGILTVLKLDQNVSNKSEMFTISWAELGNTNCTTNARIYKHEDRERALLVCGWSSAVETSTSRDVTPTTPTTGNAISRQLEQLEVERHYTRAAALAVFHLRLRHAAEILNRAGTRLTSTGGGGDATSPGTNNGHHLTVVAMAMSGFTDDKNSLWRQQCTSLRSRLLDPYLRAIFAFLTADNYNYEHVLNENGMALEDRVAFACTFLPDNKLYDYLRTLTTSLIEEGDLDGLLLTGNDNDGLKLLQRYVDITYDIQSAALLSVRAFSVDSSHDWIQRTLLDTWQLWNERALFDIMLSGQRTNEKHPQQVYVSCNFCGKSISMYMQGLNRRQQFSRIGGTPNKLKMSSCPNCRKPLPRCAICMMHMGTTTGVQSNTLDGGGATVSTDNTKLVDFANWFTWCQTCRHGGHASHMTHWFREHSECPVTACTCRCFSVDSLGNLTN